MKILETTDLERMAPSIFATSGTTLVSPKYQHIPTIDTVEALKGAGFFPVSAEETRARRQEKIGRSRHMLRFRREDTVEVGGMVPEIVLINSHDGSSSYHLRGGIYRMVCSNGMVVGDEMFHHKVRHQGDTTERLLHACNELLEKFPRSIEIAEQWKSIEVSPGVQLQYAEKASKMKWNGIIDVNSSQLLRHRRAEDEPNDLWTLLNKVQENLMRGGLTYYHIGEDKKRTKGTTRAIKSVAENERVNVKLWNLTQELADCLV